MECIISNMSLSTSLSDNVWKGLLCTCNKDYCNNASASDIHEMFSNDAVKNLPSKKNDLVIQALAVFFFFLSLNRIAVYGQLWYHKSFIVSYFVHLLHFWHIIIIPKVQTFIFQFIISLILHYIYTFLIYDNILL